MKTMKAFRFAVTAVAMLLSFAACSPDGNRRDDGNGGNPPVGGVFEENPDWTMTYTGRTVDTSDGVYVVDVIHMKSADALRYYIDLVSLDEYRSTYKSNVVNFINGSYKNLLENFIASGDSDAKFDALDAGNGRWVAVAYEIGDDGRLGSRYSLLQFETRAITMRKDQSYEISYDGRKTVQDKDGAFEADVISVRSHSDYSYYVDIAYPEYILQNYDGDPVGFFNDVLDNLASGLGEGEDFSGIVSSGDLTVNFERLRHGDWTAYAFGVDYLGNLTGNWSELKFDIAEEEPEAEFSKWLGKWAVGSDGIFYNIDISSAEANMFYSIQNWETGNDASDFANQNVKDYVFEASYDRNSKELVFNSQYLGTLEDQEIGLFDVCFLGNIRYDGKSYTITDIDVPIARAKMNDDGRSAKVEPEYVTVDIDGNYTTKYTSMQFVDLTDDNLYVYNDKVPSLPMTMTKISDLASASADNPLARTLPSRRSIGSQTMGVASRHSRIRTVDGTSGLRKAVGQTRSADQTERERLMLNSGMRRR